MTNFICFFVNGGRFLETWARILNRLYFYFRDILNSKFSLSQKDGWDDK